MALFSKSNSVFALNFSDASIEAVKVQTIGTKYSLTAWSSIILPAGVIEDGQILSVEQLKKSISDLLSQAKPQAFRDKEVVISIPESKVFSLTIPLPTNFKATDIENVIRRKSAEEIPVDEDLLLEDYQLSVTPKGREVFYAATYRKIVEDFTAVLSSLGLKVRLATMESMGLAAAVLDARDANPTLLVDIGSRTTIASIFTAGRLRESVNIAVAGSQFTEDIVKQLGMSEAEAEDKKQRLGLLNTPENTIVSALQPRVDKLLAELKSFIIYWQRKSGESIAKVVLAGGSSQLPGLDQYCSQSLGLPTDVATNQLSPALVGINIDPSLINMAKFLPVLGLAILSSGQPGQINFLHSKMRANDRVEKPAEEKKLAMEPDTTIASTAVASKPEVKANTKRPLILLAMLVVAIGIFTFLWLRSSSGNIPIRTQPQAEQDTYKDLSLSFVLASSSNPAIFNGLSVITGVTQNRLLSSNYALNQEYWNRITANLKNSQLNASDKNAVYSYVRDDLAARTWKDNYAKLRSEYQDNNQYLPSKYLDFSSVLSTPALADFVIGGNQEMSLTVQYRLLLIARPDLQQLLETRWREKYGAPLPPDFQEQNSMISAFPDGRYEVTVSIFTP